MKKGIGETFIFKGEKYMVCEHTAMNVSLAGTVRLGMYLVVLWA